MRSDHRYSLHAIRVEVVAAFAHPIAREGGIFGIPPGQEMRRGVTNYVNVDDLGAKEDLIRKGGGQIYKSKQEVPGMGWFTIFADPDAKAAKPTSRKSLRQTVR